MEVNIEFLRKKINQCDDKIISILSERISYVSSISDIKESCGETFRDFYRERQIIERLKKNPKNLRPEFIEMLYLLIFGENEVNVKDKM